jgi:hypothetical protein
LYHAALELAPDAREALLAQTDPDVRQEVVSLLNQDGGDGPLERPALARAELLG